MRNHRSPSKSTASAPRKAAPILWRAPLLDPSGYADEARQFLFALEAAGIQPVAREIRWSERIAPLSSERERLLAEVLARPIPPRAVHVCHIPPPQFERFPNALMNVGRAMFETDRLPVGWAEACNRMDAIWVPSEFNRQTFAFAGVEPDKLRVVPETLDFAAYAPNCDPLPIDGARGFNFLSVFNWTLRKGWDVLIRAYVEEFAPDEDVALLIKTHSESGHAIPQLIELAMGYITHVLGRDPNRLPAIQFLDMTTPDAQMPNLYRAADCYVMPTRGEGWGRPFMEAMAMERPVIATNWSGQTAFLTPETALLLDYALADVFEPAWRETPTYRGHRWAEPSLPHLRTLMRRAFEDRAAGREMGARARAHLETHFSYAAIAQIIEAELKQAASTGSSQKRDETTTAESIHPSSFILHPLVQLGESCFAEGRMEEAAAHFQAASRLAPDSALVHNNLCVVLLALNRSEEAVRAGERAVELDPAYAEARFNLGAACQRLGRLAEAGAQFRKAAELQPNRFDFWAQAGLILWETRDFAAAREAFAQCVALEPENAAAHFHLGLACRELSDWESAEAHFNRALQLNPDLPGCRKEHALALVHLRRWIEAGAAYGVVEPHRLSDVFPNASWPRCLPLYALAQAPRLAPQDLAQWLPVGLMLRPADPYVEWQYAGDSPLDDPFFYQTEERLIREHPQFPTLQTDLSLLEAFAERFGASRPEGVVFHLGRCGSTVVSNALRAVRGAVSLSEPAALSSLLWPYSDALWGCSRERFDELLPRLLTGWVAAFRQRRSGTESRLFLKMSAWNVLRMDYLRTVWPDTPFVYMYRDPFEVLASNLANPPRTWLRNRRMPGELVGIPEAEAEAMTLEEYAAIHMGAGCRAALNALDDRTALFNYNELSVESLDALFRFFGIADYEGERDTLLAIMATHAKDPQRAAQFVPDNDRKRRSLTDHARAMATKYVAGPYAELESLRTKHGLPR